MSHVTAAAPVARAITPAQAAPTPFASNTLGLTAEGGGKSGSFGLKFDIKKMLLFGAAGAVLGMLVPVIPGGPIGGALIGAGLAMIL